MNITNRKVKQKIIVIKKKKTQLVETGKNTRTHSCWETGDSSKMRR